MDEQDLLEEDVGVDGEPYPAELAGDAGPPETFGVEGDVEDAVEVGGELDTLLVQDDDPAATEGADEIPQLEDDVLASAGALVVRGQPFTPPWSSPVNRTTATAACAACASNFSITGPPAVRPLM
jgi:hypothetical protein